MSSKILQVKTQNQVIYPYIYIYTLHYIATNAVGKSNFDVDKGLLSFIPSDISKDLYLRGPKQK